MWLDVIIALSCGGGGIFCGWVMNASCAATPEALAPDSISDPAVEADEQQLSQEKISEVADRLRSHAMSMSANVDAHQSRVQTISDTLTDGEENTPEAILAAVTEMVAANEAMQAQLQNAKDQIDDQAQQIETAEKRAQTDALTRVANRLAFNEHFVRRHAMGVGEAGVLAIFDVDHFKQFNDTHGHRAGDEVLKVVAGTLHSALCEHGLVARYGGEEFGVILHENSIERASELIEQARAAIGARSIYFEGKHLQVHASAGVAGLLPDETMEQWLQRSDDGLYKSKEAGRDCAHRMDGVTPIRIPSANQPTSPANEQGQPSASEQEKAAAAKTANRAFAYLPNQETLAATYQEMQGESNVGDEAMFLLAIRYSGELDTGIMQSLLQIVRAGARNIDRIGCADDTVLLLCMPSASQDETSERASQIVTAASAIKLKDGSSVDTLLSIAVSEAGESDEFNAVVDRVLDASKASQGETIRIC